MNYDQQQCIESMRGSLQWRCITVLSASHSDVSAVVRLENRALGPDECETRCVSLWW
jgi:hypothetical protein